MLRRKDAGLTQQELANAIGVTARTVQRWEGGEKIPVLTPLQTWRLCVALKCSAEDLARDFYPEEFSDGGSLATESEGDSPPK